MQMTVLWSQDLFDCFEPRSDVSELGNVCSSRRSLDLIKKSCHLLDADYKLKFLCYRLTQNERRCIYFVFNAGKDDLPDFFRRGEDLKEMILHTFYHFC